jgi:hypothetical protein
LRSAVWRPDDRLKTLPIVDVEQYFISPSADAFESAMVLVQRLLVSGRRLTALRINRSLLIALCS